MFPEKFVSCLERAVLGPPQLEMIAQRGAFVFGAEQTSLLKYRHHELHEILKTFVEIGRHHVEAVSLVREIVEDARSIWPRDRALGVRCSKAVEDAD